MIAKLFVALLALSFIAVSDATSAVLTYSDPDCTNLVGFYAGTDACNLQKRSTQAPSCAMQAVGGPWYKLYECTLDNSAPTTPVPEGMQSLKTAINYECDFSTYFDITATTSPEPTSVVIYASLVSGFLILNTTIDCNNVMSYHACIEGLGCNTFPSIPNDVCTNSTVTISSVGLTGIQSTCFPPPQAPVAAPVAAPMATPMDTPVDVPVAAPVTTPVAAPLSSPKAATPVRKSSDALALVAGTSLLIAIAALL